ncbi:serine hydrolase domain-containing protein [uncultured Erythrobacter sp.]|uniref:serine hydrolase domain-containing protein n=1 Tax=uncultured Erythrobacter sp. TaxID=263913 RepID=UPI0026170B72|nr:serine hydrolase domain-containing protein [uncultured Erythrobacter sp.]
MLAILPAQVLAQNERSAVTSFDEIDALALMGLEQLNAPGAAIAIFENGAIVHQKGFGRSGDIGSKVTPQTPFQIASLTKSFTALIILQLEQEGRLSISDPVVRHIPYFRTSDAKISNKITIRNLMNHRSGLSTLDGNRYQTSQYRGKDATERAVRWLSEAYLESAPGTNFNYSNANYATLAHLIETIEQKRYEDVVRERIFSELGMENSYVQLPDQAGVKEAKGHLLWFGHPFEDHFIASRMMVASGGVTTSIEDLAIYLIAVSEGDPRIVPRSLTRSWIENRKRAYEFGWEHEIIDGQHIIFHDGANPGFRALMMYNFDARKGAVFAMNASGALDGNLHYGVTRFALDLPSVDISPSKLFTYLLWGSTAMLIGLSIACGFSIRRLLRLVSQPWRPGRILRWSTMIIPSLALAGYAFGLWFYVPRSFGVNFSAVNLFTPDLGLLLMLQIAIASAWAVLRFVALLRRLKTHKTETSPIQDRQIS